MKKKITKTIAIIVFVMFLGIKKVEASNYETTCVYEYQNKQIVIGISHEHDTPSVQDGVSASVRNWDSGNDSGFSGYDYYLGKDKTGRNCPPYIYIDGKEKNLYFTNGDSTIGSKVKKYAEEHDGAQGFLLLSLSGYVYGDKGNITQKKCSCSDSGGNVTLVYEVTSNIENPRVKVKRKGKLGDNENILNWNTQFMGYSYVNDLAKRNVCAEHAIYASSDVSFITTDNPIYTELYLSDNSSYNAMKNKLQENMYSVYLDCKNVTSAQPGDSDYFDMDAEDWNAPEVEPPSTLPENDTTYKCGADSDGKYYMTDIPETIPRVGKFIYNFFLFLVPLIIIILGSIDLVKAITSQKEDEIAKGRKLFIKRLIEGLIIFFAFAIVKLAISLATPSGQRVISCIDCVINFNGSCIKE